jgi:hypothetical protein
LSPLRLLSRQFRCKMSDISLSRLVDEL